MDEINTTPAGIEVKKCPRCGKTLPAESVFCSNCGLNLKDGTENAYAAHIMTGKPMQDISPLSTGAFLGMLFLLCIPVVNFILLLVWAFSDGTNANRRNFSRAYLLYMIITIAVSLVISIAWIAIIGGAVGLAASSTVYPGLIAMFL